MTTSRGAAPSRTRDFPYSTRPTGWFQLGWSQDFPVGEAVPLHFFGTDLVAYRGESGTVRLRDAHCAHLGAHLGHGGVVQGDDLVCPFHGWRYDAETGRNVDIPYSRRDCFQAVALRCWHVREHAGVVFFWHDVNGVEPAWEPPRAVEELADYYPLHPHTARAYRLRLLPQFIGENAVDFAHFQYAHKAAFPPVLREFGPDGAVFHAHLDMTFGGHTERTWLTPQGPVVAELEGELHGVGLNVARFHGDGTTSLVAITPIDDEYSLFQMTNYVARDEHWTEGEEFPELARRRIAEQFKQAERDHVIWVHMRYRAHPPLVEEERPAYQAYRRWARAFYPGEPEYEQFVRAATAGTGTVAATR